MRSLCLALTAIAAAVVLGGQVYHTEAGDKKDSIVGSWKEIKVTVSNGTKKPDPGPGHSFWTEFTKEGKYNMIHKTPDGSERTLVSGTYEVKGDSVLMTFRKETSTAKIKTLNATDLVFEKTKGELTVTHEFKKK